jgi:hypothetical protein
LQPGHEYTKGNVKFALSVSQDAETKRLEALANNEKETQGKSTIGDEKVRSADLVELALKLIVAAQKYNVFMRVEVSRT